jgi:multicomponent Na+:H+ antiporter subunit A
VIALLLAHAVAGLGLVAAGGRVGRVAVWIAALPPAATLGWLAANASGVLGGEPVTQGVAWVPALGVDLDLRLDGFAALFVLLIAGIGVLVFAYSARYLDRGGAGEARLLGLLVLFAGSMLGLVLADNLVILFGFWELTSVTSFLLIGDDHRNPAARAAALQALLVTGLGGLALLAGVVLVGQAAGSYSLSTVLADPPAGTTVTVGLALVLVGAFSKSAQYPFHSWLPAAMAASTPVSTYLHSATMVKAGVYLIGRFAPAFDGVWLWRPAVVGAGLVTMLAGGLRALRQHDLKRLLAFGTVSQLGFMVVLLGLGTPATLVAGCALVLAHGLFKAALFMVVGIVEHQAGTRDVRRLARWGPGWRPTAVVTVVSAASMAGVPLTFGFIAKEEDFAALAGGAFSYHGVVLALVVAGSTLTAAYSLWFGWGVLGRAGEDRVSEARPPGAAFLTPAALLAALTVVLGVAPAVVDRWAGGAARALAAAARPSRCRGRWSSARCPTAAGATWSTSSSSTSGASTPWGRSRCSPPRPSARWRWPGPGAGPAAGTRPGRGPPRRCGCGGWSWWTWPSAWCSPRSWWARCTCCSPATTSPGAASRAGSWPAPAWRCATWRAASTTSAACPAPIRGPCWAPGCWWPR